jgi:DNA-binding transcriptional LysR family regulator
MVALELRRLRVLRELEVRGTLGAVAAALGYTPSAVSQQLAVLEREAGTRLLEKAGRGVRLTDAGRLLARHARVLLSAAEAAEADLASLTGEVRGTVRAGGLQSATRRLLIPAVARLLDDAPQVRVEVTELELEQALPELRLGALDLVVSDEYDGHPGPARPGCGTSCCTGSRCTWCCLRRTRPRGTAGRSRWPRCATTCGWPRPPAPATTTWSWAPAGPWAGTNPTCGTAATTPTSSSSWSARRAPWR